MTRTVCEAWASSVGTVIYKAVNIESAISENGPNLLMIALVPPSNYNQTQVPHFENM